MSDLSDLGGAIVGEPDGKTFRLGVITDISGLFSTPRSIKVDGRVMRFVGNGDEYDVGDTVIYVVDGVTPFVLGALNNGANVGWGTSSVMHRDGGFIGVSAGANVVRTVNLYPAGGSLNIPDRGGALVLVTLGLSWTGGSGAQAVDVAPNAELDSYATNWRFRVDGTTGAGHEFVFTSQFYREFASPDSTWQPSIKLTNGGGTPQLNIGFLHVTTIFQAYGGRRLSL